MKQNAAKAFTLIELLIVVAIIAILAAIAVPNFLEAQTRAKGARAKNDLRNMATAMETYFVDNNRYTRDSDSDLDVLDGSGIAFNRRANGAFQLTTPIAYMSSLMSDPFAQGGSTSSSGGISIGYRIGSGSWSYDPAFVPTADTQNAQTVFALTGAVACWVSLSPGPDRVRVRHGYKTFPYRSTAAGETAAGIYIDYDPTNGTISGGDILRFGGSYLQGDWDRTVAGNGPKGPDVTP